MTNRIRHFLCGHDDAHVVDYGDENYRWQLRCRVCGCVEHWSHAEYRSSLRARQLALVSELLTIDEEAEIDLH